MRNNFLIIFIAVLLVYTNETYSQNSIPFLKTNIETVTNVMEVSKDGHSLLKDGNPFFWMGDTGWFLFSLSPDEVDLYFKNRADNQFNVIQMMVTWREFNQPEFVPNYRGDLPFENLNPVKLNEAYFSHLDIIVQKAEEYNLTLVIAPTWGPVLDQIFSIDDPGKAYDFGYLLGNRYENNEKVIWIVCGEFHKIAWDKEEKKPDGNPDKRELNLLDNLARGLEAGHKGKNLMTIHPDGHLSSSDYYHNASWLDFNMVQSWAIKRGTEYDIISDYRRIQYKPTILSEPGYENGGGGHKAFETRYEGYHSVMNGGFGYTYGCEGVWNFEENWRSLLDSEGALQMKYLKRLFESRPLLNRVPAPEMVVGCVGDWVKKTKPGAARADDGSYAFIYFPSDTLELSIRVCDISGILANAWWYNCRDGEIYDNTGKRTLLPFAQYPCRSIQINAFDPPGNSGTGYDWVLILDDSDKGFGKPNSLIMNEIHQKIKK